MQDKRRELQRGRVPPPPKRIQQQPMLQQPLLQGRYDEEIAQYPDDDKYNKPRSSADNKCNSQVTLLSIIAACLITIVLLVIVVVVSVYGPYGKVTQMISTADTMLTTVNNSGIASIVFQMGQNWIAQNQTAQLLALMNGAADAGDVVFGIIEGIEPELVLALANQTSITVTNLLTLIDNIVTSQGLNIQIPLGKMKSRRLL